MRDLPLVEIYIKINFTKEIFKIIFNPMAIAPFIIGVFVS